PAAVAAIERAKIDKPILTVFLQTDPAPEIIRSRKIPAYQFPETAATALARAAGNDAGRIRQSASRQSRLDRRVSPGTRRWLAFDAGNCRAAFVLWLAADRTKDRRYARSGRRNCRADERRSCFESDRAGRAAQDRSRRRAPAPARRGTSSR